MNDFRKNQDIYKDSYTQPDLKHIGMIAKAQLAEKALYYSGELSHLTTFKLPKLGQSEEYSQYLEGGNQSFLLNKKKLDSLNQSEIQIQPNAAGIYGSRKQSTLNNQSGLSDSIKKQFDYNILRSQQKSRVRLASIMVNSESKNYHNKSFLESSKRNSIVGKENGLYQKIYQSNMIKQHSESVSTQCQTPRRRFASPVTMSEMSNKESRLNKSVCENPTYGFQSPQNLNRSTISRIPNESPSPVRSPRNIHLGLSRLVNENSAENKKAFTDAYNFSVSNTNNTYQYNPKVRSLSQNDEVLLNEFSKMSSNNDQQSKIFITSEPSVDQLFVKGSLSYLDHSAAPKPQHNNSISSLAFIPSPQGNVINGAHKSRRADRYPSVQPPLQTQYSLSNEKKKRSESVDKPMESTVLLRRKNSGVSTSSNVTSISRMSENNVIRSLKRMLQNRISVNQLQIHQDQDCRRLLNHFTNKWYDLISSIQRKDLDHTLFLVIQLLNTLVDLNDMNCFLHMLLFLSKVYIDFLDYDKALFFLSQGKIICDYTQNFSKKIEFLKLLAQCANGLKDYKAAVIFLKKALQYSWLLKDSHQEIFIYDKLGLNYYYLGELETSKYYHDRFMNGDCECQDSPNRQMAEQDIQEFLYVLDCKTDGFTRLLFGKLSLPIINIYDNDRTVTEQEEYNKTKQSFNFINQHNHQNTCDKYKIYTYKTCDGRVLLDQTMKEKEFKFEMPTPIYSQIQKNEEERLQFYRDIGEPIEEPRVKKRMALPQVLVKELEKRRKEKEKFESKNRNLNDPSKYKISYQTRLKQMLNDKETYESTMERVQKYVKFSCFNSNNTQQVLLNHLDEDRQKMLNEKIHDPYSLKKRYESLLSDIVAEFILRKNGQPNQDIYII